MPALVTPVATASPDGPVRGGVLQLLGAGDVAHLDAVLASDPASYRLLRTFSRQLLSVPAADDPVAGTTLRPDLAVEVPAPDDGGLHYAVTLKRDVLWNAAAGPRQVTAADAARGIKRLCDPLGPSPLLPYYTATVAGLDGFCRGLAGVAPTVAAVRSYVEATPVSGLEVVDDYHLRITLTRPAGDFLDLLALPPASPAPVEYLDQVPDSPELRQHLLSDGPYLVSAYRAGQQLELTRNPSWRPETDELRAAYVDRIDVALGAQPDAVQPALAAGQADLALNTDVPPADVRRLHAAGDQRLRLVPDGAASPYLALNLASSAGQGALANLDVRRALNYAVDKRRLADVLGGPLLRTPNDQLLTPPQTGYKAFSAYPTPESRGDPDEARRLLAGAGYAGGVRLRLLYPAGEDDLETALQADLAGVGIGIEPRPLAPAALAAALAGTDWDLALVGPRPDWYGDAGRSFLVPMLAAGGVHNGYDDQQVDELIDKALAARADLAAGLWHTVDELAMADAPWVPLLTGTTASYRSERVRNARWYWNGAGVDYTAVWLAPPLGAAADR